VACPASATAPTIARAATRAIPSHFGFWIADFGLSEKEPGAMFDGFFFMAFLLIKKLSRRFLNRNSKIFRLLS
jgi:hypothetical protein